REDEAGRRNQRPVWTCFCIFGITPQRVVVADAVCVVTDVVPRCLVTPRLDGIGDRDTNGPPKQLHALVGDGGESLLLTVTVDVPGLLLCHIPASSMTGRRPLRVCREMSRASN